MKKLIKFGLFALPFLAPALAGATETLGEIADNHVLKNLDGIFPMLEGFCYLAAAWLSVKGAIALKDHNEDPRHTRLSKPLVLLCAATLLLSLPAVIGGATETIFGQAQHPIDLGGPAG